MGESLPVSISVFQSLPKSFKVFQSLPVSSSVFQSACFAAAAIHLPLTTLKREWSVLSGELMFVLGSQIPTFSKQAMADLEEHR